MATSPTVLAHFKINKDYRTELNLHPDGRYDGWGKSGTHDEPWEGHGTYRIYGNDIYPTIYGHKQ